MSLKKSNIGKDLSENITDIQDSRGIILDYITMIKKEDLPKQLCPLEHKKFVLGFEDLMETFFEGHFSKALKISSFIKTSTCFGEHGFSQSFLW